MSAVSSHLGPDAQKGYLYSVVIVLARPEARFVPKFSSSDELVSCRKPSLSITP